MSREDQMRRWQWQWQWEQMQLLQRQQQDMQQYAYFMPMNMDGHNWASVAPVSEMLVDPNSKSVDSDDAQSQNEPSPLIVASGRHIPIHHVEEDEEGNAYLYGYPENEDGQPRLIRSYRSRYAAPGTFVPEWLGDVSKLVRSSSSDALEDDSFEDTQEDLATEEEAGSSAPSSDDEAFFDKFDEAIDDDHFRGFNSFHDSDNTHDMHDMTVPDEMDRIPAATEASWFPPNYDEEYPSLSATVPTSRKGKHISKSTSPVTPLSDFTFDSPTASRSSSLSLSDTSEDLALGDDVTSKLSPGKQILSALRESSLQAHSQHDPVVAKVDAMIDELFAAELADDSVHVPPSVGLDVQEQEPASYESDPVTDEHIVTEGKSRKSTKHIDAAILAQRELELKLKKKERREKKKGRKIAPKIRNKPVAQVVPTSPPSEEVHEVTIDDAEVVEERSAPDMDSAITIVDEPVAAADEAEVEEEHVIDGDFAGKIDVSDLPSTSDTLEVPAGQELADTSDPSPVHGDEGVSSISKAEFDRMYLDVTTPPPGFAATDPTQAAIIIQSAVRKSAELRFPIHIAERIIPDGQALLNKLHEKITAFMGVLTDPQFKRNPALSRRDQKKNAAKYRKRLLPKANQVESMLVHCQNWLTHNMLIVGGAVSCEVDCGHI